jgi:hypothetical protein
MRGTIGFLVGFASGWAMRSSVDTANGLAIKSLELFVRTRSKLTRWAAIEREQIADLLAEVQSRYETTNGSTAAKSNGAPERKTAGNGAEQS